MYKAKDSRPKQRELQHLYRTSGPVPWLSATTAPKGTYSSVDVVDMLRTHLEPADSRERFDIIIADDFSAHKMDPVRDFVWSQGVYLLILGGGVTGAQQPCDIAVSYTHLTLPTKRIV